MLTAEIDENGTLKAPNTTPGSVKLSLLSSNGSTSPRLSATKQLHKYRVQRPSKGYLIDYNTDWIYWEIFYDRHTAQTKLLW